MTPGGGVFGAVEAGGLARAMREWLWLYPGVEVGHILGIAILVGSVVVFDMRLLGVGRHVSVRLLARFLLPWSVGSLLLIVPTGLMMFSAHATDFVDNPAFKVKLLLLIIAGANAGIFHTTVYQGVDSWDKDATPPLAARAQGLFSLLLWVTIITCGRLIAYT